MNLAPIPLYCYMQELLHPLFESPRCRLHDPPSKPVVLESSSSSSRIYDAWLASRILSGNGNNHLSPGARREITAANIRLAFTISQQCAFDLFCLLWSLHPIRISAMVALDLLRGIFPAFRGYSQAMIIDELQQLLSSGNYTWSRLSKLILTELFRMALESVVDSLATTNENVVQNSARFAMEYKQMEQRVRMDVPTLADPIIRDLFHESDLFVRSFNGMSSFGLLSPFDYIRILTLFSELISHALVLWSLTSSGNHRWILIFSIVSTVVPLMVPWVSRSRFYFDESQSPREARTAAKQEKMRALVHSDPYRPEVILFGLGPWILQSWATARRTMLGLGATDTAINSEFVSNITSHVNITGLFSALQNIPLVLALQSSSASLGSFALYRTSIQCLLFTARNMFTTAQLAFQGIFLLGAFGAAMEIEPLLQPKKETALQYCNSPKGMKIEARNLSYYYPGSKEPALKNLNFTVESGETLAIVGFNGSGKSTLANVLLRILEFDGGELLVNGHDIRRYQPAEFHQHVTAVFQCFSKFNASVRENIGIGYIPEIGRSTAIEHAADLAGAGHLIWSLPKGLKTRLSSSGFEPSPTSMESHVHRGANREFHGLSGGEWQRIAISRAFMRAHRPEVELVLLDEPTSSLDAHAQNKVFETVETISRSPEGNRTKTVIFITHRLSTARRADKIAMMENGTITEFGTHQELLDLKGSYAALYNASV